MTYILSSDQTYYILKIVNKGTLQQEIIIPEKYKGLPVKAIGEKAFSGYLNVISIKIPSSITKINASAFDSCIKLNSVEIPNSVTSIGNMAFYKCSGFIIYCEAKSQPSGWNISWNYSKCPVVLGYTEE